MEVNSTNTIGLGGIELAVKDGVWMHFIFVPSIYMHEGGRTIIKSRASIAWKPAWVVALTNFFEKICWSDQIFWASLMQHVFPSISLVTSLSNCAPFEVCLAGWSNQIDYGRTVADRYMFWSCQKIIGPLIYILCWQVWKPHKIRKSVEQNLMSFSCENLYYSTGKLHQQPWELGWLNIWN